MIATETDMAQAHKTIDSPVGRLTLIAGARGLTAILWETDDRAAPAGAVVADPGHPVLAAAARQLDAYFAGELTRFTIPLDFAGTDFQKSVWTALLAIPFGETRSYGDIARAIGQPGASRAVGMANNRNPIPIIAPCHRVIGADGSLVGFGGGLPAKEFLLRLEGRAAQLPLDLR